MKVLPTGVKLGQLTDPRARVSKHTEGTESDRVICGVSTPYVFGKAPTYVTLQRPK